MGKDDFVSNHGALVQMISAEMEAVIDRYLDDDLAWAYCRDCGDDAPKPEACRECLRRWLREPCDGRVTVVNGKFVVRETAPASPDPPVDWSGLFDLEEVYPDCTVQVLRNSQTGEISVGWWPNGEG